MANFNSSQLGDVPYVDEDETMILLPGIAFRHHYKVQDWINGTDRNAEFSIAITHIEENRYNKTTVALRPATKKVLFYWRLRGLENLEQEILDFHKK